MPTDNNGIKLAIDKIALGARERWHYTGSGTGKRRDDFVLNYFCGAARCAVAIGDDKLADAIKARVALIGYRGWNAVQEIIDGAEREAYV